MENLLKKLQEEAGLSEEQAVKSLKVVKDFMDKEGIEIDWEKFFKGKYTDLKGQAKSLFDTLSHKAREYSDIIEDKVEDLTIQAKRTARDLSQKASEILDDDKKKKE
ncbi:hypothetical protein [Dysgonomonas macrotermitis]|uniref:Uncharacterized protein n=1 Tax=Dysgonomonas macrotermitis TaxID=1346286 RepID=A0A1M5AJ46_9BACT|nr:hypothetical protein [Dysgonomonas macrotermitis]SHF30301.1 hypothetical protein SAMN05444362_10570 [Dysgonomonas macrotermitis]